MPRAICMAKLWSSLWSKTYSIEFDILAPSKSWLKTVYVAAQKMEKKKKWYRYKNKVYNSREAVNAFSSPRKYFIFKLIKPHILSAMDWLLLFIIFLFSICVMYVASKVVFELLCCKSIYFAEKPTEWEWELDVDCDMLFVMLESPECFPIPLTHAERSSCFFLIFRRYCSCHKI